MTGTTNPETTPGASTAPAVKPSKRKLPSSASLGSAVRSRLVKRGPHRRHPHPAGATLADSLKSKYNAIMGDRSLKTEADVNWSTCDALDRAVDRRRVGSGAPSARRLKGDLPAFQGGEADASAYGAWRAEIQERERTLAYDYECSRRATPDETAADAILAQLRLRDAALFASVDPLEGHNGQTHPRFPGDHFLSNVDTINQSEILKVARRLPKGAHLHIHFNSCLKPQFLLDLAKHQPRMFIKSSAPLTSKRNLDSCELQFSILKAGDEHKLGMGNLLDEGYTSWNWMPYSEFREAFGKSGHGIDVDDWLQEKLVFGAKETYGEHQDVKGAWHKFNGRTRMMKGLFNYETAYRKYTRAMLQDFVDDNIQYAEIRPNFMQTNQVFKDDGSAQYNNEQIMGIIEQVLEDFKRELQQSGRQDRFKGLKVIYCTPRIFDRKKVMDSLTECIEFKKRWPHLIAGFDVVGDESAGNPLKYFVPEFLRFRQMCDEQGLEIPFLLHCGETLEMGDDTPDGNLVDALLLNSRRIGHGFALARHPYIMEQMKKRDVCLELCPISNEVLGLTPRVNGHAMYSLLANNVHCTLNSDNGTLFRSSLSHDFYQLFVGRGDTTLYGWKQLALWSIRHACLTDDERADVTETWDRLWAEFLQWIIAEYSHLLTEGGV